VQVISSRDRAVHISAFLGARSQSRAHLLATSSMPSEFSTPSTWQVVFDRIGQALTAIARELRPSRSRRRIALQFGAIGA
jgi:hypothetical protein